MNEHARSGPWSVPVGIGVTTIIVSVLSVTFIAIAATLVVQTVILLVLGCILSACVWRLLELVSEPRVALWSSVVITAGSIPITLLVVAMREIGTGLVVSLNAAGGGMHPISLTVGLIPTLAFVLPATVAFAIRRRWLAAVLPIAVTILGWYVASHLFRTPVSGTVFGPSP